MTFYLKYILYTVFSGNSMEFLSFNIFLSLYRSKRFKKVLTTQATEVSAHGFFLKTKYV